MSRPAVVIDARMSGPRGSLARERLNGRTVLEHLLEATRKAGLKDGSITGILLTSDDASARPDDKVQEGMAILASPPEHVLILRCDRLYDPRRLRQVLRQNGDPEDAVFWRLDRPDRLAVAGDELQRRASFQPLGQYWALGPARACARWLAPTPVRPNAVTCAAALAMMCAAWLIAFGTGHIASQMIAASALALALVLDTADGHMARLQGTASAFGRWLDSNLDELSDAALHAAAAWSAAVRFNQPLWLVIGMIYLTGKYLYFFGSWTWEELEKAQHSGNQTREIQTPAAPRMGFLRRSVELAGHADLRWHLWIALTLLGRMEYALVAYAAYFPMRVGAGFVRKVRSTAHA